MESSFYDYFRTWCSGASQVTWVVSGGSPTGSSEIGGPASQTHVARDDYVLGRVAWIITDLLVLWSAV